MAMGIPLITNSGVGDVEMIVNQFHSGIVIHSFDEQEYKIAASSIAAGINWNIAEIRKGANEFYSLQTAVEKYTRIYNNILMH
jgi:hypothetical protein